jgi:hypothetical protein
MLGLDWGSNTSPQDPWDERHRTERHPLVPDAKHRVCGAARHDASPERVQGTPLLSAGLPLWPL